MGYTVKFDKIDKDSVLNENLLIVDCSGHLIRKSYCKEYTELNVNILIAERLIKVKDKKNNIDIIDEMNKCFNRYTGNLILSNFQMLFNPDYKIDVLKFFIELSKYRKIIIEWSGYLEDGFLKYSKPEFDDYKKYNVTDCNVICIA